MFKIIIISLFIQLSVLGTDQLVEASGRTTSEQNLLDAFENSIVFGNLSESNSTTLIGDDTFDTIRADGTVEIIESNLGEDRGDTYEINDETGEVTFNLNESNITDDEIDYDKLEELNITKDTNLSNIEDKLGKNYLTMKESFYIFQNGTDQQREQMTDYMKEKALEDAYEKTDIKRQLGQFYNTTNSIGSGYGLVGELKEMKPEMFYSDDNESEEPKKNLYKETVKSDGKLLTADYLKDNNFGTLSNIYNSIDSIKDSVLRRIDESTISCQISRDLIPSYYCPIDNKNNIFFPNSASYADMKRVNIEEARKDCDEFCVSDPGDLECVAQPLINDDEVKFNLLSESGSNSLTVYPTINTNESILFSTPLNFMPVNNISLKIEVNKSDDSNLTSDELNAWLSNNSLIMNYEIKKISISGTMLEDVIPKSYISINSTIKETSLFINNIFKTTMAFKVYKPFIKDIKDSQLKFLKENGITIKLSSIQGEYESNSFYFCQKQFVSSPQDCSGLSIELSLTSTASTGGSTAAQQTFLCVEEGSKIGPDPIWGGFYSENSCNNKCIYQETCAHTYFNTSSSLSSEENLYRTSIDCVDKDSNTNCSKELCEEWFLSDRTPINEIVYDKDEVGVFTIKNNAVIGVRPKIDVAAELNVSSNTNFNELFEKEQKDIAFNNMIEGLNYNRFIYSIGSPSPSSLAYVLSSNQNKNTIESIQQGIIEDRTLNLSVKFKPQSNHIDNNKQYYIYIIASVEQNYVPIAGNFYLNGNFLSTLEFNELQLRDKTFFLLDGTTDHKIFYRKQNYKIYYPSTKTYTDENGVIQSKTVYDWVNSPSLESSKYETFKEVSGEMKWVNLSENEDAEYFKYERFNSNQDFNLYKISDDLLFDIKSKDGLIIKSQEVTNSGIDIVKIYDGNNMINRKAMLHNITLYLTYSETKLTYSELIDRVSRDPESSSALFNKYTFYDYINPSPLQANDIKYDMEMNNNINGLILGDSNNTTLSIKDEPKFSGEYGRKGFKFLFIYDPSIDLFFEE